MRASSPPYLKPLDRIHVEAWYLIKNDNVVPLPDDRLLPDWDSALVITVGCRVEIDVQGILEDCRLSEDTNLRLVMLWHSIGTGLRGRGTYVDIDTSISQTNVELRISIEGKLLAERVAMQCALVLNAPNIGGYPLSPKRSGSILWQDTQEIILEGEGARFPTEPVDFASSWSWLPENSAWYLDWDRSDFLRPVLGSVRVLINSKHDRLKEAVSSSEPSEADLLIREAVRFDTARVLIMTALEDEGFCEARGNYPEGSVGLGIWRLMIALFKGKKTFDEIRELREQQPHEFECLLQDAMQLFRRS